MPLCGIKYFVKAEEKAGRYEKTGGDVYQVTVKLYRAENSVILQA